MAEFDPLSHVITTEQANAKGPSENLNREWAVKLIEEILAVYISGGQLELVVGGPISTLEIIDALTVAGDSLSVLGEAAASVEVPVYEFPVSAKWRTRQAVRRVAPAGPRDHAYMGDHVAVRVPGSGLNGPATADYGRNTTVIKDDFAGPTVKSGEIDGHQIVVRQGGPTPTRNEDASDAAGDLRNLQHAGDPGFLAAAEWLVSRIDASPPYNLTHAVTTQIGVIDPFGKNTEQGLDRYAGVNRMSWGYYAGSTAGVIDRGFFAANRDSTNYFRDFAWFGQAGVPAFRVSGIPGVGYGAVTLGPDGGSVTLGKDDQNRLTVQSTGGVAAPVLFSGGGGDGSGVTVTPRPGALSRALSSRLGEEIFLTDYVTDRTGSVEVTAQVQAAINAAISAKKPLRVAGGTYLTGPITAGGRLDLVGDGIEQAIFKAKPGTTGPLLRYSTAEYTYHSNWRDFAIDLRAAPLAVGMEIGGGGLAYFSMSRVRVTGGLGGFNFDLIGDAKFDRIYAMGQGGPGSFGIRLNGDNGAETTFEDVLVRASGGQNLDTGFDYVRTTTVDTGGLYMRGVRVVGSGDATFNYGIRFHKDAGPAVDIFLFAEQLIVDSGPLTGTGALCSFERVSNVRVLNSWSNGNTTIGAVNIVGGQDLTFANNWLKSDSAGKHVYNFTDAPLRVISANNTLLLGIAYNIGSGGGPTGLQTSDTAASTSALTNDPVALTAALTENPQTTPPRYLTSGDRGGTQAVQYHDPAHNKTSYLRRGQAHLEFLGNDFTGWLRLWDSGLTEAVGSLQTGGALLAPNLPSSNPGVGSKQFWYDPADSNRVKFQP